MRKLICSLAVIATICLVYLGYWLGNRDLGNMYQAPLPEYSVMNTNPPAPAKVESLVNTDPAKEKRDALLAEMGFETNGVGYKVNIAFQRSKQQLTNNTVQQ